MTPHMYVRNHVVVPEFAWYFLIRIGWGTGNRPTNVPCCRNLRISLSSVRPLESVVHAINSQIKEAVNLLNYSPTRNLMIPCIRAQHCLPQNSAGQHSHQPNMTIFIIYISIQTQFSNFKCTHLLLYLEHSS